jgi:hypothetical protein
MPCDALIAQVMPLALAAYRRECRLRGRLGAKRWLWDREGTFYGLCENLNPAEREIVREAILREDRLGRVRVSADDLEGNRRRPGVWE